MVPRCQAGSCHRQQSSGWTRRGYRCERRDHTVLPPLQSESEQHHHRQVDTVRRVLAVMAMTSIVVGLTTTTEPSDAAVEPLEAESQVDVLSSPDTVIVAHVSGANPRWPTASIATSAAGTASVSTFPGFPQTELAISYEMGSSLRTPLTLVAPLDQPFTTGRFSLTANYPDPSKIGISASPFCAIPGSSITINSVTQAGTEVTSLSADLHLACVDLPDVYVSVRYNTPFDAALLVPSVSAIDFGDLYVGTLRATVPVTNLGDTASGVEALIADPANAYRLGPGSCSGVLEPLATCSLTIEFVGADLPNRGFRADLLISAVDNPGTSTIEITGIDYTFHRPAPGVSGYWILQADGSLTALGDATDFDSPPIDGRAVQIAPTPSGKGAVVLDETGQAHALGDAPSLRGLTDADRSQLSVDERPITIAMTPSGWGYWIFTTHGRAFAFGDAPVLNDLRSVQLNGEIIDSAVSADGDGVFMIGSDGGVFALGGARFAGSIPQVLPGVTLDAPIVGIVADPDGAGYWLVAADGGVFAFDAPYRGSLPAVLGPGVTPNSPVNGMVPFGNGYLLVAGDGGVFNFSDQPFDGSIAGGELTSPVIAIASFAGAVR